MLSTTYGQEYDDERDKSQKLSFGVVLRSQEVVGHCHARVSGDGILLAPESALSPPAPPPLD